MQTTTLRTRPASNQGNRTAEIDTIQRLFQAIVRENLLPHHQVDDRLVITCKNSPFNLIAEKTTKHTLDRYCFAGEIALYNVDDKTRSTLNLETLIELLSKELGSSSDTQLQQFIQEVLNNIANTELTNRQKLEQDQVLLELAKDYQVETLYDLVEQAFSNEAPLFFERWASQGHPFHPCNKTKLGFNREELLHYAPEFSPGVGVLFAAIHRSIAAVELEEATSSFKSWFANHYPEVNQAWHESLAAHKLNTEDYLPLPLHPWQAQHVIKEKFAQALAEKKLILLPKLRLVLQPTLSFRTLCGTKAQQKQIKLPVAIQSTSALRTVSPASIHNSPKISRVLRHILSNDTNFDPRFRAVYDSVGIRIAHQDSEVAKHCSALFRDNPQEVLKPGEIACVAASLFQTTPFSNKPFLAELIGEKGAKDYFSHLVDTLIPAYLRLFFNYGIALEAHQQNTYLVFKDKQPVASIIRDLGGVRIHLPSLAKRGYHIEAFPGSATLTNNHTEVRNKLIHTLYQCQLGEIIILLNQQFGLSETSLWKIVRQKTEQVMTACEKERNNSVDWQEERQAFFNDDWNIKSLTAMRLNDTYSSYLYSKTANPMAD